MQIDSLFRTGKILEDAINAAPNPKPTASDKSNFGKLASLYTAFSSDFAAYALDICLRHGWTRIADPFSGMGTLADAGRARPISLQLSDISPFAVLSGAFRSASAEDIRRSIGLLKTLSARSVADDERGFFSELFSAIAASTETSIAAALVTPSTPEHRLTALTIYLAALSRIRLYKRFAGSNPTWIRRPETVADTASTRESIGATIMAALEFTERLPALHSENRTASNWLGIQDQAISPGSLDAILTSPPYANRTDYIRHYLPASELLLASANMDERPIRAKQIGTPLIRELLPEPQLPTSVMELLHKIRTHSSYASERYYYKGFLYYFSDMAAALARMHRWLRRRGFLLLVVQDTYYKEVHIPTADMIIDLATAVGFKPVGRRDWRVRQHLSQLSPHSRRMIPNRVLSESVIGFSR